jgi:MFS family permease
MKADRHRMVVGGASANDGYIPTCVVDSLTERASMHLQRVLDRERTVAPPGFNRWLIPPAALGVHMCIGEIYGFSVFNAPLTRIVGITHSINGQDWTIPEVGWIYSIALIVLGLSAAVLGRWVERVGPRKTIFASAICFCGGLWLSALAVTIHRLWLIYVGYGVIGGMGLGLGYIAPVSALVKWFPDRPGMATGLAIMGFGGGALIGAPLGVELIVITAWSVAAMLGPQLVNYVSTYRIEHGIPRDQAYNGTMYLMAGLLIVGLICNLSVRAVDARYHHQETTPLDQLG